jgi:hypothetical protein
MDEKRSEALGTEMRKQTFFHLDSSYGSCAVDVVLVIEDEGQYCWYPMLMGAVVLDC